MSVEFVVEAPLNQQENEIINEVTDSRPTISKKLYISNINFKTTEENINDFLKEFEVLSIIIPSQTIRGFKSTYQKSFGVAYIEFSNEENAELAKRKFETEKLDDRKVKIKNYSPYKPKYSINDDIKRSNSKKVKKLLNKKAVKSSPGENENSADAAVVDENDVKAAEQESTTGQSVPVKEEKPNPLAKPVSEDTVYVTRLSAKVTDEELREYFKEFEPTDVYIFKSYYGHHYSKNHTGPQTKPFFPRRAVSALIKLNAVDGVKNSIEKLSKVKFQKRYLIIRAAYLSKIEEVERAAESRRAKLMSIEDIVANEDENSQAEVNDEIPAETEAATEVEAEHSQ